MGVGGSLCCESSGQSRGRHGPASESPPSETKIKPKADSSRWLKLRVWSLATGARGPEVGLGEKREPYKRNGGGLSPRWGSCCQGPPMLLRGSHTKARKAPPPSSPVLGRGFEEGGAGGYLSTTPLPAPLSSWQPPGDVVTPLPLAA